MTDVMTALRRALRLVPWLSQGECDAYRTPAQPAAPNADNHHNRCPPWAQGRIRSAPV